MAYAMMPHDADAYLEPTYHTTYSYQAIMNIIQASALPNARTFSGDPFLQPANYHLVVQASSALPNARTLLLAFCCCCCCWLLFNSFDDTDNDITC